MMMKTGGPATAKTAAAAFQAAAAEGGSSSKATKQRERRLLEALVELRQSLTASAAAGAAAGARAPRSVIAAVAHACLLGESSAAVDGGAAGAAAPMPPSAPIRVLAYQTLLSVGPALRAHVTASAPLRASLLRAIFATLNTSSSDDAGVEEGSRREEAFMDEDLAVLALRTLLRAVTDGHLVVLVRDPLLLSPLRATLSSDTSSSASLRQQRRQQRRRAAMLSLVGQGLLPRLLRSGGLDTAPLGQVLPPFPSAYDALRFRQEARDAVMDLAKSIVEACEAPESPADVDGHVSAAAFLALDSVLAEGGPLLLAAEVAALVDADDATPPFPSATAQEVALSVLRHALARFPRLLLRFGMGRKRSTGALGCLSRLVEYVLLEHTNAAGMLLAPPPQPDKVSVIAPDSSTVVHWAQAHAQIAEEWVQRHLAPAALEGVDPEEAWVAITWALELLHLPALRHWREALAPPCLERLLGLYPLQPMVTTGRSPSLLFPRASLEAEEECGAKAAFERTQASLAALCCVALKWCPLPSHERLVPRLLQLLACLTDASARASLLAETLLLCLCNGQRNGRLLLVDDGSILLQRCLFLPSEAGEGEEDGAAVSLPGNTAFLTELHTALLSMHLRLCPLLLCSPTPAQQPFPPLTRLTTAAARARLSGHESSSNSNAVRWLRLSLLLLRRLSGVTAAQQPPAVRTLMAVAPLGPYISLLACVCRLLLLPPVSATTTPEQPPPPPPQQQQQQPQPSHLASSFLPPKEKAEMAETLKGVLVNLLQFCLPEGIPDASQRLRILRLLAQYAGSIGAEPSLREQMAMDLAHFLAKELVDGQSSTPPHPSPASALEGTLGGGQTRDFPTKRTRVLRELEGAVWRARGAVEAMVHLAISLSTECPSVPQRVVSLLNAALAGVDQQLGGDDDDDSSSAFFSALACYREGMQLALRRVEAAVGGGAAEIALLSCFAGRQPLFSPTVDDAAALLLSPNDPAYAHAVGLHSAWVRRFEHRLLLLKQTTTPSIPLPTAAAAAAAPASSPAAAAATAIGGGSNSLWEDLGAVLPFALTGGSDPIHLTAEVAVNTPSPSSVRVRVRAFNATNCRIDALRLHLRLLDPTIAALSPHSTAAVAALFEGEGAGPLPPGAALEVDFLLHVVGNGDLRLAWDIGFPQLDAPLMGDEGQAKAAEALWARLLRAEQEASSAAGAGSAEGEEASVKRTSSSASASRMGRVSSLGKSSHSQHAPPSSKHPLRIPSPLPPSLKGGQRRKRTVWCRSDTLIVPFPNLLRPPPEAEVVVGGAFQALWAALPYGQARPVESDSGLVLEVLTWWQQRQQQPAASAAVGGASTAPPFSSFSSSLSPPPTESLGVHALMAISPHASRRYELLPSSTWRGPAARALREKGRVRSNAAAAGDGGGSRFFSDAWVFRTATGCIVAAVLSGVGVPPSTAAVAEGEGAAPCWRGRLEVRCDDEGVLRRHITGGDSGGAAHHDGDGHLRRFLGFLTNDVFVPSLASAGLAAAGAAGVLPSPHASSRSGGVGSEPSSLLASAARAAPPLSLSSFLAPTRTGSLATATTTAAAARVSRSNVYGSAQGLLRSMPGGSVGAPGSAVVSDVFLPLQEGGSLYAPNDGVGASLGPAAVTAQVRGMVERRQQGAASVWRQSK